MHKKLWLFPECSFALRNRGYRGERWGGNHDAYGGMRRRRKCDCVHWRGKRRARIPLWDGVLEVFVLTYYAYNFQNWPSSSTEKKSDAPMCQRGLSPSITWSQWLLTRATWLSLPSHHYTIIITVSGNLQNQNDMLHRSYESVSARSNNRHVQRPQWQSAEHDPRKQLYRLQHGVNFGSKKDDWWRHRTFWEHDIQ